MSDQKLDYEPVLLYTPEGDFLGYAIRKTYLPKLSGTHIYVEEEEAQLKQHTAELNDGANVRANWPAQNDPEFVALIRDPEFMPIEYTMQWVVDDAKLQEMIDTRQIEVDIDPVSGNYYYSDEAAVPKILAKVPADPHAPTDRLRKAALLIAEKRAGINE